MHFPESQPSFGTFACAKGIRKGVLATADEPNRRVPSLVRVPMVLSTALFLVSIYYSPGNLSSQFFVLPPAMAPLGPHRHGRHLVYVVFCKQNCEPQ